MAADIDFTRTLDGVPVEFARPAKCSTHTTVESIMHAYLIRITRERNIDPFS